MTVYYAPEIETTGGIRSGSVVALSVVTSPVEVHIYPSSTVVFKFLFSYNL